MMRQSEPGVARWRVLLLTPLALAVVAVQAEPLPGGSLDPLTIPKYVTPLVIPPVMDTTGTPNDFEIAVRQFQQQILPGGIWATLPGCTGQNCSFPATTVWSYGPAADPTPSIAPDPASQFNYPAYTVEALKDITTNVDWLNELVVDPVACKTSATPATDPACNFLPHILPVDRALHWANPEGLPCIEPGRVKDCAPDPAQMAALGLDPTVLKLPYDGPVPMVPHLHGSHATPESDGYAEAWWLPAANNIDCRDAPTYPATPDLTDDYWCTGTLVNQFGVKTNAIPGAASYKYLNDQPAATFWYHDHSLGMTRNNVYAGPAGFYILRDPAALGGETGLVSGTLPGPAPTAGQAVLDLNVPGNPARAAVREIPIVIQDRAFNTDGSLFYPDNRAFFEGLTPDLLDIPFIGDAIPSDIAAIWNPEAFFNTMVVNGVSWPSLEVEPDLYRFRLLNGCNSRFINLALFEVTGPGTDGIFGTADDTLGAELPFYQIGAEQSLLPKVVEVKTGFKTPLPGDGTIPAAVAVAAPEEALLMSSAERADVIVDFSGLAPGTRVRMVNTGPDEPFGGFPVGLPPDPDTTAQVMEFSVGADDPTVGEGFTPPAELVLSPVENVDTYPAGLPNVVAQPRDQALLEEESILICVTINAVTGAITYDSTAVPNPADPTTCVLTGTTTLADSLPFGPKAAVLGINGASSAPTVTLWSDPIQVNPQFDQAGNPPTETWELWNHTVDAHPIHVHEVKFKVINRQAFDPLTGALTGPVRPPEATEAGWKDTVIAYPGDVTRIATTFDIQGLYMWHCHIVEHEDNEMMVPYCIGNMDPTLGPVAPGCILNEPPVAVDDSYSVNEDTTLTVPAPGVLANDTDINANNVLTAVLETGPANGTLTLNPDGSFSYTPNPNFNGTDTFTYKANDGVLDSLTAATVTITVNPVNVDMRLDRLTVPRNAKSGEDYKVTIAIANVGEVKTSGTVTLEANGSVVKTFSYTLAAGRKTTLKFEWIAPVVTTPLTVNWLATVVAAGDDNPANNSATATTQVKPEKIGKK
jgi:spore coat protein A, manganese oxidase